jgi:hypothetical protein
VAGAILLAPNSALDVVVFDPAGAGLARKRVSGGPAVQEFALGDLAHADLPLARVESDVVSRRAAGYVVETDNISGDGFYVPAVAAPANLLNTLIAGASALTGSHTDLRLFNPSTQAATVQISIAAANAPGFAPPSQPVATLLAQSTSPLIVLSRTVAGSVGALQEYTPTGTQLEPGQTGRLRRLWISRPLLPRWLAPVPFKSPGQRRMPIPCRSPACQARI